MKHTTVGFIGYGEIARAINANLKKEVTRLPWDKNARKVRRHLMLDRVVDESNVLFFCVPTRHLRVAITQTLPFLSKKTICVFVSKGIEPKTNLFVDEIIKDALPSSQPAALLSGPMLAEELVKHKGGAAIVATKKPQTFQSLTRVFKPGALCLSWHKDLSSIALAGALKNIYAIALGVAFGLKWGHNRRGWLCANIINEMHGIMKQLGRDPTIALSQAGLGDFIATGFSSYSSNHTFGRRLARHTKCKRDSEGCFTLPVIAKLLKSTRSYPVLHALRRVLLNNASAKSEFKKLCG